MFQVLKQLCFVILLEGLPTHRLQWFSISPFPDPPHPGKTLGLSEPERAEDRRGVKPLAGPRQGGAGGWAGRTQPAGRGGSERQGCGEPWGVSEPLLRGVCLSWFSSCVPTTAITRSCRLSGAPGGTGFWAKTSEASPPVSAPSGSRVPGRVVLASLGGQG